MSGFTTPPTVFDITDPLAPRRGADTTFAAGTVALAAGGVGPARQLAIVEASSASQPLIEPITPSDDLHGESTGADYLVITPANLRPAADRLALHRGAQGLRARVVALEDIYAEFSGGHPDPDAIKAFLRWAVSNWPAPQPAYAVLLGDGHYDYRNRLGTSSPVQMPVLLQDNPSIGVVANENGLAAVSGDDALPDLFLGRLPANTPAEADAIVDKLIQYDLQPVGEWQSKALRVWDNDDAGFETFTAAVAQAHTGLDWDGAQVTDGANVRAKLAQGPGLVLYVGHGYMEGWADEQAFTTYRLPGPTNDLDGLGSDDRTGIWVTANCLNGYFHDPVYASIGEDLVRKPHGGAVGFWGTSGYTLPVAQYPITERFMRYLVADGLDLGTASTLAKIGLFLDDSPYWRNEVAAWLLLGDPATKLRRPAPAP